MHVLLYCFKDVGAVEIGVRKVGGIERDYKNACDWIGMETICNHLVLQRSAQRSVSELAAHLKMIIREEKKLTPPKDPALVMPKRIELPTLGTATRQLMESEASALIDEEQFRREANELRKQREARGEGCIFSVMQPLYCPELDELIDKRIDVLYSFVLGSGEKVLRWCQGKVIQVLPEKVKPTVVVRWDPMPDVKGKEDLSDETQQVLPPRKWNKDVEGAWRMDINVRFVENTEDYEGVCGVQSDLNVDGKGDSSESESCTNLSDGEDSDSEGSTD